MAADGPEITQLEMEAAQGTGPVPAESPAPEEEEEEEDTTESGGEGGEEEGEGEGEEGEEPSRRRTPAEARTLDDLLTNPDLARQYEQRVAQDKANAAVAARRQAEEVLASQQRQQEWNQLQGWRNQVAAYRQREDADHTERMRADPIGEWERWETVEAERQQQDGQYQQAVAGYQQRHSQALVKTQVQTAEQQAFQKAFDWFYRGKLAPELQKAMANKSYPGSYQDGYVAWLAEYDDKSKEHWIAEGRKLERQEAQKQGRQSRTRELSAAGLAEPRPDVGATASGGGRSRIPSPDELEHWTWEQRETAKARDPHFYDKVYGGRAASRR